MISTPDWTGAACADVDDIRIFHPRTRWDVDKAKAVCHTCPLIKDCLVHAIRTHDEWAILGGTTPKERGTDTPLKVSETHCKNGHEWNEVNTYWKPDGYRECRACKRDRSGVDNRRRREATLAGRISR